MSTLKVDTLQTWDGTKSVQVADLGPTTASAVANIPAGNIAATTVQAAINELDSEKVGKTGAQSMTGVLTAGGLLSNAGVNGYGPGAGGTATQPTSLTDTPTINKPSGAITLSSAIPPGGDVVFQVLNSHAANGDLVVASLRSSLQAYSVEAESCTVGGFRLRVRNSGGGTYTLVPVIDFVILKGAKS